MAAPSDPPTVFPGELFRVHTDAWKDDADLQAKREGKKATKVAAALAILAQAYGTLGIVYGDIGTSPLYALSSSASLLPVTEENVLGVLSTMFWSLTLILIVKYCFIVLLADDNGNGGPFALYALLRRATAVAFTTKEARLAGRGQEQDIGEQDVLPSDLALAKYAQKSEGVLRVRLQPNGWRNAMQTSHVYRGFLKLLVILAVGLVLGDGVLTPAVSVTSAVEGIKVAVPTLSQDVVIVVACVILGLLFAMQGFGTHRVSVLFSPVVLLWFTSLLGIGTYNLITFGSGTLKALSPHYAIVHFINDPYAAWKSLSSVLLCFTGVEALFADLGHFNRRSMQLSCIFLTYPSVLTAYFGQAAYLLQNPDSVTTLFYDSVPDPLFYPILVLATAATVVASQALISAVFSIVMQAVAQGFFPRLYVKHTSSKHYGQVYVGAVNWLLMVLCIAAVAGFRTSTRLGNAYGLTVNLDIMCTTIFVTMVMLFVWRMRLLLPILFFIFFITLEGLFLSSSVLKVPVGGWFPLTMAAVYASLMYVWQYGNAKKHKFFKAHAKQVQELVTWTPEQQAPGGSTITAERLTLCDMPDQEIHRDDSVGLFYTQVLEGVPQVLQDFIYRLKMVPQVAIIITNRVVPIPEVLPEERLLVEPLPAPGFYQVVARYGYMEKIVQDSSFGISVLSHIQGLLGEAMRTQFAHASTRGSVPGGVPAPLVGRTRATMVTVSAPVGFAAGLERDVEAALRLSAAELDAWCMSVNEATEDVGRVGKETGESSMSVELAYQKPPAAPGLRQRAATERTPEFVVDVPEAPESEDGKKPNFDRKSEPLIPADRYHQSSHPFTSMQSSLPLHGLPAELVPHNNSSDSGSSGGPSRRVSVDPVAITARQQLLSLQRELRRLVSTKQEFVFVFGKVEVTARQIGPALVRLCRQGLLGGYMLLARNVGTPPYKQYHVPLGAFLEIGSVHEI